MNERKLNQSFKQTISFELQIKKQLFQRVIQIKGLINCKKITKGINDTIPKYRIDNFRERYRESLLKKTDLTMKKKIMY